MPSYDNVLERFLNSHVFISQRISEVLDLQFHIRLDSSWFIGADFWGPRFLRSCPRWLFDEHRSFLRTVKYYLSNSARAGCQGFPSATFVIVGNAADGPCQSIRLLQKMHHENYETLCGELARLTSAYTKPRTRLMLYQDPVEDVLKEKVKNIVLNLGKVVSELWLNDELCIENHKQLFEPFSYDGEWVESLEPERG